MNFGFFNKDNQAAIYPVNSGVVLLGKNSLKRITGIIRNRVHIKSDANGIQKLSFLIIKKTTFILLKASKPYK